MKALLKALGGGTSPSVAGAQGSEYYNEAFARPEWREHYPKSAYYFLWTVLVDRIVRSGGDNVIELGCGPGQLACMLRDKGVKRYLGLDFSSNAISIAREVCPEFSFQCADLTKDPVLEVAAYDCVVTLEFLEHVEPDLEILRRIRPGTKVYATVPNFPYISHVRHFVNAKEVTDRYAELFIDLRVDPFLNAHGKTFYLMEGTKRS